MVDGGLPIRSGMTSTCGTAINLGFSRGTKFFLLSDLMPLPMRVESRAWGCRRNRSTLSHAALHPLGP